MPYPLASYNGQLMELAPGDYTYINKDRAVYAGGINSDGTLRINSIEYISITIGGTAVDFGDLWRGESHFAAFSDGIRGVWGPALIASGWSYGVNANVIKYVTIATCGNSVDFGDTTVDKFGAPSCADKTRGVIAGGTNINNPLTSACYITIQTTGNAINFGDITYAAPYECACADATRGIIFGDFYTYDSTCFAYIQYITIQVTSSVGSFGNLNTKTGMGAALSDFTRGICAIGFDKPSFTNAIEWITIQTTGVCTDFGDLTILKAYSSGCSNNIRGLFIAGYDGVALPTKNNIESIIIQTASNSTDFADCTVPRDLSASCSGN